MNDKKIKIYVILICIMSMVILALSGFIVINKITSNNSTNSTNKQMTQAADTNIRETSSVSTPNANVNKYSTSNVCKFSVVNMCDNKLYCSYAPEIMGSVNNSICAELPYDMYSLGHIYSFAYYNGCIYYVTGDVGTSDIPCSIYKYDMNERQSTYITDNIDNRSACYIANGILFYELTIFNDDGLSNKNGIGKVNLRTGEYNQIYTNNTGVEIKYCSENCLYIKVNGYYEPEYFCIDSDGNYKYTLADNEINIVDGYISGNYTYSFDDETIYQHQIDGDSVQFFSYT